MLSDVVMPSMGGVELARRLRARWPAMPILLMSGHSADERHRQGALGSELIAISKPFTTNDVVASVVQALAEQPSADSAAS